MQPVDRLVYQLDQLRLVSVHRDPVLVDRDFGTVASGAGIAFMGKVLRQNRADFERDLGRERPVFFDEFDIITGLLLRCITLFFIL